MATLKKILIVVGVFILLLTTSAPSAQNNQILRSKNVRVTERMLPASVDGKVQRFYRRRADGKPGREVMLYFKGGKFSGKGIIDVVCADKKERIPLYSSNRIDSFAVLLPPDVGVKVGCAATFVLSSGNKKISYSVFIPALRQWTVYIYPHSHVDIGYTNTQANVEVIHKRNLINGIELAKKTANYPRAARYTWNPEVLWPVERYLSTASQQQKQYIINAVKKGYLNLDASYVNTNTSAAADEELFEFLGHGRDIKKLTGTKIETFVQVDVPGMAWGIVPVAAANGIKYIFAMNNGFDRVGRSTQLSFKPFWWKSEDGKSKVLFLQPGSYTPGARAKGFEYWPKMAGQTDTSKLLQIVKTDHPRQHFVDQYLSEKLPELEKSDYYPYDIFAMSWAMADNTPIDADLPDAVKSWNEDYAFPHLVIAGATEIMRTFEQKYGGQLPVLSGDFTEYWTDGLGTAAKQTSMNRTSKERLIQDQTLWTMLHPGEPAPRAQIKEAWRNVSMGTEHTWCYMTPSKQPITNDILQVKFGYFQQAEDQSKALMNLALSTVAEKKSPLIGVFNTLSWERSGLVCLSDEQSGPYNSVRDDKDADVIAQRLSTGELVFLANNIPAFGSRNYLLKRKQEGSVAGNFVKDNVLDNGIVKVVIDRQTGDISSLLYGGKEFVNAKAPGGINNYRYLHGNDNPEKATVPSNVKITIKENGPLLATVLVKSDAEGCNELMREVTIIAGSPFIEIKNVVDKQAITSKEGIHFGFAFNISKPVIRADIAWGVMEVDRDQLAGANRNWIGFQRWLDISGGENGITWCSLDAPVFEVGTMTANIIGGATNSSKWISKIDSSATIYSWALNNHWHTNYPLSQEGKITFRYRVLPHNTVFDAGLSNRFGLEQAQPLIAAPVKNTTPCKPILSINGCNKVVISILETNADGNKVLVRLRSVSDKEEKVTLNWLSRKPLSVSICDQVGGPGRKNVTQDIKVPANGLVTLEAKFPPMTKG